MILFHLFYFFCLFCSFLQTQLCKTLSNIHTHTHKTGGSQSIQCWENLRERERERERESLIIYRKWLVKQLDTLVFHFIVKTQNTDPPTYFFFYFLFIIVWLILIAIKCNIYPNLHFVHWFFPPNPSSPLNFSLRPISFPQKCS